MKVTITPNNLTGFANVVSDVSKIVNGFNLPTGMVASIVKQLYEGVDAADGESVEDAFVRAVFEDQVEPTENTAKEAAILKLVFTHLKVSVPGYTMSNPFDRPQFTSRKIAPDANPILSMGTIYKTNISEADFTNWGNEIYKRLVNDLDTRFDVAFKRCSNVPRDRDSLCVNVAIEILGWYTASNFGDILPTIGGMGIMAYGGKVSVVKLANILVSLFTEQCQGKYTGLHGTPALDLTSCGAALGALIKSILEAVDSRISSATADLRRQGTGLL